MNKEIENGEEVPQDLKIKSLCSECRLFWSKMVFFIKGENLILDSFSSDDSELLRDSAEGETLLGFHMFLYVTLALQLFSVNFFNPFQISSLLKSVTNFFDNDRIVVEVYRK